MKEITLHILDILENSLRAGAGKIILTVNVDHKSDILEITVADDGCGMDEEELKCAVDPFYTTRSSRNIGMGLPLFLDSTRRCGGFLEIQSQKGKGTKVRAVYRLGHIDRPPMGSISKSLVVFLANGHEVQLVFKFSVDGNSFCMDTEEIKQKLGQVPIYDPEVLCWLEEYIDEGIKSCGGAFE